MVMESQVLKTDIGYSTTKKMSNNNEKMRNHRLGFTLKMVFGRNSPVINTMVVASMVCISVIKNSFPIGFNQGVINLAINRP